MKAVSNNSESLTKSICLHLCRQLDWLARIFFRFLISLPTLCPGINRTSDEKYDHSARHGSPKENFTSCNNRMTSARMWLHCVVHCTINAQNVQTISRFLLETVVVITHIQLGNKEFTIKKRCYNYETMIIYFSNKVYISIWWTKSTILQWINWINTWL